MPPPRTQGPPQCKSLRKEFTCRKRAAPRTQRWGRAGGQPRPRLPPEVSKHHGAWTRRPLWFLGLLLLSGEPGARMSHRRERAGSAWGSGSVILTWVGLQVCYGAHWPLVRTHTHSLASPRAHGDGRGGQGQTDTKPGSVERRSASP